MDTVPINQDFIPLLQGLRPFLGSKGQNVTDVTLNFVKLVSSDTGRETLKILNNTMNPQQQDYGSPSPLQYAFILFLILILLILSSNILIPHSTEVEEEVPAPSGAELPEPIGELV